MEGWERRGEEKKIVIVRAGGDGRGWGDVSCGRERKQRNVEPEQRGPENTLGAVWCADEEKQYMEELSAILVAKLSQSRFFSRHSCSVIPSICKHQEPLPVSLLRYCKALLDVQP